MTALSVTFIIKQALNMEIKSLFDLSGKVAVVTGGGDGIGKGCCEILAAAGASVVVSDISADKAKSVADGIVASGGKAISGYAMCLRMPIL